MMICAEPHTPFYVPRRDLTRSVPNHGTSHILTPYPGTVLYDRLKKEDRILIDGLSLYNTSHVVFAPKNMTKQELYDGYL